MFTKFKTISVILVLNVFLLLPVAAKDYGLSQTGKAIGFESESGNIYTIVNKATSAFLGLLAIIFFTLTVWAGVRWMTARGNEEYSKKAKETLEASVIGLVIILASYALVSFVFKWLGA